jgi:cytosine/adenosine deaminase-related metal-dependent hydrolase
LQTWPWRAAARAGQLGSAATRPRCRLGAQPDAAQVTTARPFLDFEVYRNLADAELSALKAATTVTTCCYPGFDPRDRRLRFGMKARCFRRTIVNGTRKLISWRNGAGVSIHVPPTCTRPGLQADSPPYGTLTCGTPT